MTSSRPAFMTSSTSRSTTRLRAERTRPASRQSEGDVAPALSAMPNSIALEVELKSSPPTPAWALERRVPALLDRVVDLEQRHVHRDHDEPDDAADHDEHHGLEDRGQRLDGRRDLVLVEVGDLREHRVERARLLAHADHVADHAREDGGLLERVGDRAAALDALDDLGHRVLDDAVAGRLAGDVERGEERDA